MFPRTQRISRKTFPLATQKGRRLVSPSFTLVVLKEGKGYAVVLSKKITRLSVARHKIKRRILTALRSITTLPKGLVIYPHAPIKDMSYQDIKEELYTVLSKHP